MATKGFNPFLSEADFPPPPPPQQQEPPQMSNPFLSDFGPPPPQQQPPATSSANDNPFFNPFGAPPPPPPTEAPFAFTAPPPQPPSTSSGGNPFASFVTTTTATAGSRNGPFSGFDDNDSRNMWDSTPSLPPSYQQEPILMMDTGPDEHILQSDGREDMSDPTRPPPPSVPRSTKELLDSVTGALEANSDSLMDRLRLAQPSPVNLVPSPSPSPRSPSPDLLGGDDPPPPPPSSANPLQPSPHQIDNIIDLFDTPMEPPKPSGPKTNFDILGLYNTAPQQPPPQQKQPPPPHIETEELVSMVEDVLTVEVVVPPESLATTNQPPSLIDQIQEDNPALDIMSPEPPPIISHAATPPEPPPPAKAPELPTPPKVSQPPPSRPEMPEIMPLFTPQEEVVQVASVPAESVPVKTAPPPDRPKLPPQPAPGNRSPLSHEAKPFPSRPPPPVPPAPRITPSPSPSHHPTPPAIPPQPIHTPAPPPPVPPQPHVTHHPPALPPQPPSPRVAPPVEPREKSPFHTPQPPPPPQAAAPNIFSHVDPSHEEARSGSGAAFFGMSTVNVVLSPPAPEPPPPASPPGAPFEKPKAPQAAFDDFDAKFNSATDDGSSGPTDAFGDPFGGTPATTAASAWGNEGGGGGGFGGGFGDEGSAGFGSDGGFDSFLQMTEPPPVPQSTPAKMKSEGGEEEEESGDLSIFIRPRSENDTGFGLAPALAPPPKSPAISTNSGYSEDSVNTAFVPFLSSAKDSSHSEYASGVAATQMNRTDSQETPDTPLFEEDTSQPLEDFPRIKYEGDGWDMHMRHPNKKKITGQRFWKKVYVQIGFQNDVPIVQIYTNKGDKDPFQEIPLQPCYSCSEIGAQQFDQYGKIFTMKIQYVFYKERPGVRPGQISKAGRISDKLSQFAAFAIQGDYQGVKEFGSDLKKLGLPLEHAPQISQLVKLGTQTYEELKQFSAAVEEALFKLNVHRDRAIQYKTEEIQVTIVDEYYVEQDTYGVVTRQIARVRLFFLSFLSGIAEVEMGMNDLRRQGKEVVGRHDIIPIATEEWIRTEDIEFSNCVQLDEFEATKTIKFKPPDASYFEILRFRVRPPRHRELPLQVKTVFTSTGNRIEIRSDILVPGFTSRKLGQIPCEDVTIRFPIPECWIYMFRVEKHFRYGSVKSAHRRSGKVKGIERFLGAVEAVEQSLMEVTSGQAKYEHQHRAIVWRIPRLPKEGQGAYTTHSFFCHITLQAHEQLPENLSKYCFLEFTMPHTTVSHTVVRSISVPTCEEPPEKCVRYLSRHEYQIEIEHTQGFAPATYNLAAATSDREKEKEKEKSAPEPAAVVDRTEGWFPEEKPKADDDSDFSDD